MIYACTQMFLVLLKDLYSASTINGATYTTLMNIPLLLVYGEVQVWKNAL